MFARDVATALDSAIKRSWAEDNEAAVAAPMFAKDVATALDSAMNSALMSAKAVLAVFRLANDVATALDSAMNRASTPAKDSATPVMVANERLTTPSVTILTPPAVKSPETLRLPVTSRVAVGLSLQIPI